MFSVPFLIVPRMEEYRSRVELLEVENAQLQACKKTNEKESVAPSTPNWIKN